MAASARRRILVVAVVALVCGSTTAALEFAPVVRSSVEARAAERGLSIEIGSVSPGWFAVILHGVRVQPVGVAGIYGSFASVRLELSSLLSLSRVSATDCELELVGSASDLESAITKWRASRPDGGPSRKQGADLQLGNVEFRWFAREGEPPSFQMLGGSLSRAPDAIRATFDRVIAESGRLRLEAHAATVRADGHGILEEGHVADVAIALERSKSAPTLGNAEPSAPPPSPPGAPKADTTDRGTRLPLPDLARIHAGLVTALAVARPRLAADADFEIDEVAFAIGAGERRLSVGRGPLSAKRAGASLELTFATRADADGTPLTLRATLPMGSGDVLVSLSGGPASLARLGVDEGAGGLVAVDRATVSGAGRVSLSAAGDALTFDGNVALRGLAIDEPHFALQTIRDVDLEALARGVINEDGTIRVDDAEIALGALRLLAHGNAQQTDDHLAATLSFELAGAPCDSLLRSLPSALVPTLDGAEVTGSLHAAGHLAFDSRDLEHLVLDSDVEDRCSMVTVPEGLAKERFTQPFEHTIYEPDGTLAGETTGPGSDNWSDLSRISPFLQVAVLTTEDGAFYRHHGFNGAAMRNALVADLKAGHFVRGASTITMQLAKNLFLSRDKTLSRKLEEIILADYLESTFTKQEMMELYLNVIEFGPGIYGVTHAAAYYFGRTPAELNLAESLFLASTLPSPLRFAKLAEKPRLSDSWSKRLRDLMLIAAKLRTISPAELEEGLKEEVVFHAPQDPPPEPRPPVTGTYFQTTTGRVSPEWEETP